MQLNLALLYDDLSSSPAHLSRIDKDRRLRHPALLVPGRIPHADIVYVVTADELDAIPDRVLNLEPSPSFACAGTPSERVRSSGAAILWFPSMTARDELLSLLVGSFDRYNQFHLSLERSIARNVPIASLGEEAANFLDRPVWLWDAFHQTIFYAATSLRAQRPAIATASGDGSFWLTDLDGLWDENTDPEPAGQGFPASSYRLSKRNDASKTVLCQDVFIGENKRATLAIEESGRPFTPQDGMMLDFLVGIVSSALKRDSEVRLSAPRELDAALDRLLDGESVGNLDLEAPLRMLGWQPTALYACVVCAPADAGYPDSLLSQTAEKAAADLGDAVYSIREGTIVFVLAIRGSRRSSAEAARSLDATLRQHRCRFNLAASSVFSSFGHLHLHYRQAVKTLGYGIHAAKGREPGLFLFDDYLIDGVVENILSHASPEAVCPAGLTMLLSYDRSHDTNLAATLKSYLDSGQNVSETARTLYMHRNTLLGRLRKIDAIIEDDLTEPRKRLAYLLALEVLAGAGEI